MGYKFKPNKAVAKRFKVTKTGKLKRHHAFTSHLMSARPAKTRRKLRRSAVLFEGLARNMRELMGISHVEARPDRARAGAGGEEGRRVQSCCDTSASRNQDPKSAGACRRSQAPGLARRAPLAPFTP